MNSMENKVTTTMFLQDSGKFEPALSGSSLAILVKFIHVGFQESTYADETKIQNQVMLTWELPDEMMDSGKPFIVSKTVTLSLHEKSTLRAYSQAMFGRSLTQADFPRGTGFDPRQLLGKPCMLAIEHKEREGRTFARIVGCVPVPRGTHVPKQVSPTIFLSLDDFDEDVFDGLPEWLRDKISKSSNYETAMDGLRFREESRGKSAGQIIDDDLGGMDAPRVVNRPPKMAEVADGLDDFPF